MPSRARAELAGRLSTPLACIRIRRSAHTWDVFGLPARDMRSRAPAAGGCFRLSSLEDLRTVAQRISNVRGGGSPPMRHSERHRSERVGWLRASVLGANDGIVSTASL